MTALLSQFARIPSNPVPSSPQPPPSSGSSTRFSLSLPREPSLDPVPRSPSLFSSLLSSSSAKTLTPTAPADPPLRPPNPPAPLPRPRALSSSHLPPPFPSPSGAFLPPPSSWLPLVLPPASHRKRSTRNNLHDSGPNSASQTLSPNGTHRRSLSQSQSPEPHSLQLAGHLSDGSSLAEHAHRRSAPSLTSALGLLHSFSSTTTVSRVGGTIRIRDFGFPPEDSRHTGILQTPRQPPEGTARLVEEDPETRAERSASYLCMPSTELPTLWSRLATTGSVREENEGSDEDEPEAEVDSDSETDSESGLREEIERRRESLDKSLHSVGRPSIGSGLDEDDSEDLEGLWVALYAFEAEGESEMGLVEGEVVRVVKAVCDGWVVARKVPGELDEAGNFVERVLDGQETDERMEEDANQMGLCPQNYLTRLSV